MEEADFDSEDEFGLREDSQSQIEDLSWRVEQLEAAAEESGSARRDGIGLGYALGMAIAVNLSWARNASILWCILHGLFSWGYVIYFAVTR
jgi:predicted esterase